MSMRAIFQGIAQRLLVSRYEGVDDLADVLAAALNNGGEITIREPIVIKNLTRGPAIKIIDEGGYGQAIEIVNSDGQRAILGIGLHSEGVVANELIYDSAYSIGPGQANQVKGVELETVTENNVVVTRRRQDFTPRTGYTTSPPVGEFLGCGSGIPGLLFGSSPSESVGGHASVSERLANWLKAERDTEIAIPGGRLAAVLTPITVTATHNAENGQLCLCDPTVANFTVTLPAEPVFGDHIGLKNVTSLASRTVTVDRNGKTIDNDATNIDLSLEKYRELIYRDSDDWTIVGSH